MCGSKAGVVLAAFLDESNQNDRVFLQPEGFPCLDSIFITISHIMNRQEIMEVRYGDKVF
jgi:hypothetical protein